MDLNIAQSNEACPTGEISAYIDGELSPAEEMSLEMHLVGCPACVRDLNAQKHFLRALDISLEHTDEIELPTNFTKTVVTTAESRVSGLRRGSELRNALLICSALLLIAIFAVGKDLPLVLSAFGVVADKVFATAAFAGHFVFDIAIGVSVIFRSLASQFVFGSTPRFGLFVVIFGFAFAAFSRLLDRGRQA
ncbi:MAG: zf-HC2 domain-containing protein [Acidobacteriota bacterium]